MKIDGEVDWKLLELCCDSSKCRAMVADLSDLVTEPNSKMFLRQKEQMNIYTSIALDYIVKINEQLLELNKKCELIKSEGDTNNA